MPGCTGEVRRVLVLYTGGTIGMIKNQNDVYVPASNMFIKKIKSYPELHNEEALKKYFDGIPDERSLMMPSIHNKFSLFYTIKEYNPLLDSSNMSAEDWIRIAKDIETYYYDYDGFVILHGTDTLAYTASALSFMLEGLQKSVIVSGSQIPIFEPRSDAKDNFLSSLIFAGCYQIPEVCVCFANRLLRGNRTVKYSSNLLEAFNSPNYSPLGDVGIQFKVNYQHILKRDHTVEFKAHTNLNKNVGMLLLFPTVSKGMIKSFLKPPIAGMVLLSYGIGNIPSNRKDLVQLLSEAVKRGVLIVNISQCSQGTVNTTYETGKALEELGIIPGYDMTLEAALAKLSYVLSIPSLTIEERRELMKTDIRGELTI